jgi:4-amino-4-deoxy-L-arabinose transferase-like glycosyltransferase
MNSRTARLYEYGGALIVLLVRIVTAPRTPWENDEFLFAEAVRKFDPSRYHPHPPGYPLFVLLGKAFAVVTHDPWRALVVLNIVLAPIAFIALTRAFRNWIEDEQVAAAASLIYFLSAAMLVHGPLALSDAAAMAFVCLAFSNLGSSVEVGERSAIALGLWTSAAIGTRPPLLIPLAPLLVIALIRMRTMRQRTACIITFGFVSLMWFLPLLDATGGWNGLVLYETKQAAYFATHDAAMSRGAFTPAQIALRFLIHPWGSKYLTLPLLVLVLLGIPAFVRRWRPLLPLIVFTVVQLVFELASMDPADAARYSLPIMAAVALLAALGLAQIARSAHMPFIPIAGSLVFALCSGLYVRDILVPRMTGPSPTAAAAQYIRSTFPPNTVVLFDLSMRPAVESLLPQFQSETVETGLKRYYDQTEIPLALLADGGSHDPDARTFSWPESDAYGKLTRNHYRVVTADTVTKAERYAPVEGVYALERTIAGQEWRWLAPSAAIALPRGFSAVTVTLALSPDAPYDSNPTEVTVNGRPEAKIDVTRQPGSATVNLATLLPPEIEFRAAKSFRPADVLKNRDPRTLAVELLRVEQKP